MNSKQSIDNKTQTQAQPNLRFSVCHVLRTRFGLTQCELAQKVGLPQPEISEMEARLPHRELPGKFLTDYPYGELGETHNITAAYYRVVPKPREKSNISGIAYHRLLRELRQEDLSQLTSIPQCDLSLYETGARTPSIHTCKRLAQALDTTVQALLATYAAPPRR